MAYVYYSDDCRINQDLAKDTIDAGTWAAIKCNLITTQSQMRVLHDDLTTLNHTVEGVGFIGVVLIVAFALRTIADWCAWGMTAGKIHAGIEDVQDSLTGISAATFSTSERLGSVGATLDDIDTNTYKTRKILRRCELRSEGQDAR